MRGERLKQAREEYGDTQQDLADFLGSTVHSVANWENGRGDPKAVWLLRTAARYNRSAEYLMGFSDDQTRASSLPPEWEQVFADAFALKLSPVDLRRIIKATAELLTKDRSQ